MARALSNQILPGDQSLSPARAGLVPEAGLATQDYFHKFDGEGVQELDSAGRAHGDGRLVTSPSIQDSRHTTTQGAVITTVVHVTQGSAPESDRHPQNSPTLDGDEERNGCVAQMDMPLNHAAVTADESRASADEIQDGERHSEGSELDHSSDLGGHSRYTRALVQPEGPSCGDEASSALYRGIVMVETREAHNLEVAGSNPAPATSSNNFPPRLCTLAGKESCPDDPKEEVLSATQHHNRGLAQYPPATSVCEPAESERGEPLSVSDESGWNLQRVRLLTLSSPPVESGAEQGATLVSAPGFLPRKFSWASDEDCESLAAAQAGMIGGMQ